MKTYQITLPRGVVQNLCAQNKKKLAEALECFGLQRWTVSEPQALKRGTPGAELTRELASFLRYEVLQSAVTAEPLYFWKHVADLIDAIDVTGGVVYDKGRIAGVGGEPEWLDLGVAYAGLCDTIGIEPLESEGGDELDGVLRTVGLKPKKGKPE